MNNDIVSLYNNYNENQLSDFFDRLIEFINKYERIFSRFVFEDTLQAVKKLDSSDFYLGTSKDNTEGLVRGYAKEMVKATKKEICYDAVHLIWDIAAFTTQETCPSCQDDELKIASSTDQMKIYKVCDNCLITQLDGEFVDRPQEMIPATKKQVHILIG
ncbi:hypothetical protein PWEIH_14946 [Listeria weihenstephanensis FSL R9-0317]|uniref:Uncharacterized protein n=1 Tax=Listeria weihenstephanensis TaxID=1006155 RepID=A0A1S7FVT1_9LIST|nr:hypothetical protein [Listeria weihenstephanensis]AQY51489.1 hypothetical protein UE46_10880 [Listeria weihenstephanensis]EUJ35851.1 hypothetical protein PWEIH_14946 [Listeria weihenstephanensis FSL R9-0317]